MSSCSTTILRILIGVCIVVRGHCQETSDGSTTATTSVTTCVTVITETTTDTTNIPTTISTEGQGEADTTSTAITSTIDTSYDIIITGDANSTDEEDPTKETDVTTAVDDCTTETTTNTATDGPATNVSVCTSESCRNGGTCVEAVNSSMSFFYCLCTVDYVGIRCEVWDDCVPWRTGELCYLGACVYSKDGLSRSCACFPGMYWNELHGMCRERIPPCLPNPCLNGGTCNEDVGSLRCVCASGFEGTTCSITNSCGDCRRGKCLLDEKTSTKICRCDDGLYWNKERQACQNMTSPCDPEPCENGGTCVASGKDYSCECAEGFSGNTCAVVDKCGWDEDCGEHGRCTLSEDETSRTCRCDEGYYVQELPHTCREIEKPCLPNPCAHEGICTPFSEETFNCNCSAGYTGATCAVRDACAMDGGEKFCKDAENCTNMHELEVFVCSCQDGQYFNYSSRMCLDLDTCPLMRCGANEKCVRGSCVCQDNWVRSNSTEPCKPNICSTKPCPAPMICEEGAKSDDYKCHCQKGYAFNGTHCNEAACIFPILNGCGQRCVVNKDAGIKCSCVDNFLLNEDNKTCSYNGTSASCSAKTCEGGSCVVKSGKESCVCPSGYVEKRGQCVDVCTAGQLSKGVCPSNNLCENTTQGGFSCKCEGKYVLAEDKATCTVRNVCMKGEIGGKTCSELNARCIQDWQLEDGYKCNCSSGLVQTTEGMCRDVCSIDSNRQVCSAKGARCEVGKGGRMMCKCPPYFKKGEEGLCNEPADVSFVVTLPLDPSSYLMGGRRKQRSLDEPLDYWKMRRDVTLAAKQLFNYFKEANILACSSSPGYLICKLEMQFTEDEAASDMNRLKSEMLCIAMEGSDACLLPPSLVLVKDMIARTVEFHRTDPCDEDIRKRICGSETTCVSSPETRSFNCTCGPGFTARSWNYPFNGTGSIVEICRDFDECTEGVYPCPANSQCQNTIGGFLCPCKPGFRRTRDSGDEQCVEICSPNPCTHGGCTTRGDHEFECTCKAGYRGALCDLEDKNFKGARVNTIIVGVVLGGILLITIILFVVCVSRLKRKMYFDEPGSIEMTNRGRMNNAFQRE